jgi:hypothetical protein
MLGQLKNVLALVVLIVLALLVVGFVFKLVVHFLGLIIAIIVLYFIYQHLMQKNMKS